MDNIVVELENVSKIFRINQQRSILKKILAKSKEHKPKILIALDGISFQVSRGEFLSIIGLNGSGKTTLLRIIAGVYKPDSGSVKMKGRLSPLLQLGAGFQGDLTARDNIIMNGMLLGIGKSDIESKVEKILNYAELDKFSNLQIKHYSSGMRARLAFSTAMQIDPDILLVDEILSVGDKDFRKKSYETFFSYKKNKKTILHATHNLEKIPELSDRVLLIHKGKIVMIGEPELVIKKYHDVKSST